MIRTFLSIFPTNVFVFFCVRNSLVVLVQTRFIKIYQKPSICGFIYIQTNCMKISFTNSFISCSGDMTFVPHPFHTSQRFRLPSSEINKRCIKTETKKKKFFPRMTVSLMADSWVIYRVGFMVERTSTRFARRGGTIARHDGLDIGKKINIVY